ncbi:hypothetical protein ACLB2K_060404 [Fragaria x ananassa]
MAAESQSGAQPRLNSRRHYNVVHPVDIETPPLTSPAPATPTVFREVKHFKKWVVWLIPTFVIINVIMFVITMYVNNCPKNSVSCIATFLGGSRSSLLRRTLFLVLHLLHEEPLHRSPASFKADILPKPIGFTKGPPRMEISISGRRWGNWKVQCNRSSKLKYRKTEENCSLCDSNCSSLFLIRNRRDPKKPVYFLGRQWNGVDIASVITLSVVHLIALLAPFYFTWSAFWLGVALYFVTGVGVTLSFHRNLAHKSFKLPKWLEYFFAYCAVHSLQGSPLDWVSSHRRSPVYRHTE